MAKGYFRSGIEGAKTECVSPRFFKMKKAMIGMITVRIKMGRILPLCNSSELTLGDIRKYETVPANGMNKGWKMYEMLFRKNRIRSFF